MNTNKKIKDIKSQNSLLIEKSIQRYAKATQINKRRIMRRTFNFLYEKFGVKYILNYSIEEFEQLFLWIENMQISKVTKQRFRNALKNLVNYALKPRFLEGDLKENIKWNYLLSNDFFEFTEMGKKREIIVIEKESIIEFLNQLRKKNYDDYIRFSIIIYSGCRISGLTNLKVSNIDFKLGVFYVYEKKTKNSSGLNRYFLPLDFIKELKNYIISKNLFKMDNICSITPKQVRCRLKKYRKDWWPHLFRHTLRTQWFLKGMPDIDAELLLNHQIKYSNQIYLKQLNNLNHLRKVYDFYFPYRDSEAKESFNDGFIYLQNFRLLPTQKFFILKK
ncbi:MAG: tyrosine-type recombinase/integrase [Promethearchaeota archaeon]